MPKPESRSAAVAKRGILSTNDLAEFLLELARDVMLDYVTESEARAAAKKAEDGLKRVKTAIRVAKKKR